LTGIEYFTSLETLDCHGNRLRELDLSSFNNLTRLSCAGNYLTTLDVSGLSNLTILKCLDNQLTSLNVSGLSKLIELNCSVNKLTSLDLSGLNNLSRLICSSNNMPDESAVTGKSITWYTSNFIFSPQNPPPATITSVIKPADKTYGAGENLDFTVNYSRPVMVNIDAGTPYIPLNIQEKEYKA